MTRNSDQSAWERSEQGNPWGPSHLPQRDDVLSWRHAAALLLRDVDPKPIFDALPALFETIYDQTADEICDRHSGTEDRLTWRVWLDVWLEHFDSWNDPVRQLVERHCTDQDAKRFAQMLPRIHGAVFCDFVLDAYERMLLAMPERCSSEALRVLPLHQPYTDGWPFERLAYYYYRRFCRELDQEPEPAPAPMSTVDFNRAGPPASTLGVGQ